MSTDIQELINIISASDEIIKTQSLKYHDLTESKNQTQREIINLRDKLQALTNQARETDIKLSDVAKALNKAENDKSVAQTRLEELMCRAEKEKQEKEKQEREKREKEFIKPREPKVSSYKTGSYSRLADAIRSLNIPEEIKIAHLKWIDNTDDNDNGHREYTVRGVKYILQNSRVFTLFEHKCYVSVTIVE
jgi:chromosome segregation ATPase